MGDYFKDMFIEVRENTQNSADPFQELLNEVMGLIEKTSFITE